MIDYIIEIEKVMDDEIQKLKKAPFIDKTMGLLEIIRSIDDIFCHYSYSIEDNSEEKIHWYKYFKTHTNGFYDCYSRLCYEEESIINPNILFKSSQSSMHWANYTLQTWGNIGYTYRYIQLTKQEVFDVKKLSPNEILFKCKIKTSGAEFIEARYKEEYLDNIILKNLQAKRIKELGPVVNIDLEKNVFIWNTDFIKYNTNPLIDEYFLLKANAYINGFVGSDTFHDDSEFDGISYKLIKKVVEGYVAISLMHLSFCQIAMQKYGIKILNQWNFNTTAYKVEELISRITNYTGINREVVAWVTRALTLTKSTLEVHTGAPGSSLPPLIKVDKDCCLRSLAGFLSNPFTYLIRHLKYYYNKDYSVAVNKREEMFKMELYSLFDNPEILKCNKNIELKKDKKVLTDIDAALYDIKEQSILLIQLKWMDDFGTSMIQRKSMKENFYTSITKWIDGIKLWINENHSTSLLSYFDSYKKTLRVKRIELLILGRNFSSFSGIESDKRSAFCAWPQLVKILKKEKNRNSISKLIAEITKLSVDKINLNPIIPDYKFKLGEYTVTISFK